jgi:hypothetical protein
LRLGPLGKLEVIHRPLTFNLVGAHKSSSGVKVGKSLAVWQGYPGNTVRQERDAQHPNRPI